MLSAERLFQKISQLPSQPGLWANCETFCIIIQLWPLSSDTTASRKEVYLFYNPPNNPSRRTHEDRSCTFCGFFRVSLWWIVDQHFIPPSLVSAKRILLYSMTDWKFSLKACSCSFLGLYLVEPKSHDWYQIGQRISSPLLNHVVTLIQ